ncbi:hypothetical protein GOP47_0014268 [Adiantum capillus-veneris]|uniref:Uncharacterized protein n=1 Tax=Adiantum capillus-veneris TaxID=13818 RepID=A0A9D4ZDZ9_ADICA|nr:hypothetical protein GOP47_0014268 [Adiantum capillus-veneris]
MGEIPMKMRKGLWSPDEDEKLSRCIAMYINGSWSGIARKAGLHRCGKSCRRRWMNHLRPDLKRGRFTPTEISRVVELHNTLGNRWSEIASHLVGRTDNDVKNLWNTQIKRQFKSHQISSTTYMTNSDDKNTSVVSHIASPHHDVPVEPSQCIEQQIHLNATTIAATNDTIYTSLDRCMPSIASNHMKIDSTIAIANGHYNIALKEENHAYKASVEFVQHKEEIKLQTMCKNSINTKSVFTFPFNCPIPSPHDSPPPSVYHQYIEQLQPTTEELVFDDIMKNGAQISSTTIDIPCAHSSLDLTKLPMVPPNNSLAYTTSLENSHWKQYPLHANMDDALQPEASEACSAKSCSINVITSSYTTIHGPEVSNVAHDSNTSTSLASSMNSIKRGLTKLSPVVFSLPPIAQLGQPKHTTLLHKDEGQYEQQHFPEILAIAQGRPTIVMHSSIGIGVQQSHHDSSYAPDNYDAASSDSDATTSFNTNASSEVEDVSLYIDSLSSRCSINRNWWPTALDVKFSMPDFELLDVGCWQPLANIFEP